MGRAVRQVSRRGRDPRGIEDDEFGLRGWREPWAERTGGEFLKGAAQAAELGLRVELYLGFGPGGLEVRGESFGAFADQMRGELEAGLLVLRARADSEQQRLAIGDQRGGADVCA